MSIAMPKKSKVSKELQELARLIYKEKLPKGYVDNETVGKMAKELMPAVFQGYGKGFSGIDPEATDYRILSRLEDNVHVFSGFKTYRELQEVSALLVKDGKIVSEVEFLKAVKLIDKNYNENYRKVERDLAINSAQQAEFWQTVQEEKELFPYVEYVAVLDGHETEYCRYLNGKIFHVDDPILKVIWPPNHWRCRSHFRQLTNGTPSVIEPELMPKIAEMFQNNVGINGEVFPDTHPYFDLPANDIKYVKDKIGILVPGRYENYKRAKALEKDSNYSKVAFDKATGGYVAIHKKQSKSEAQKNAEIARELASEGFGVTTKGVNKKGKSFDANLNKKGDWEFKAVESMSKNALQKNIREAKKQASNIVLYATKAPKAIDLSNAMWNAVQHDKKGQISRIMIKVKGQRSVIISRDEIESGRATQVLQKYFK